MICDADFNRVWVAEDPKQGASGTWPHAPRSGAAFGLRSPRGPVFLTGFPLPKDNIGSETEMEILKADLFERLLRLIRRQVLRLSRNIRPRLARPRARSAGRPGPSR